MHNNEHEKRRTDNSRIPEIRFSFSENVSWSVSEFDNGDDDFDYALINRFIDTSCAGFYLEIH